MNRGIEDARRLLCVQEAYNFHHFIRDQVVHHPSAPFRGFGPVPDATSVMGRLSPRRTRSLHRHGCSHRMGLSRHVIPVSPAVPNVSYCLLHRSHHFRFRKCQNRTLPPLLFLRPRRRRCPSVLDRTDTGDKKLQLQIAQWRQDWVQLVASGRDGDALL
jgi:hypothetical protein